MSIPYMPLYVADYEADTAHLSPEEDGIYTRLLRLCWRTPGCSVPDDAAWIARMMRVTPDYFSERVEPIIAEFFRRRNARVFSPRLMAEYERISATSKLRSEAGKKGGRPPKALKSKGLTESPAKANGKHPDPDVKTVAKATDAEGVMEFNEEVWKRAVSYLTRNGVKEKHARSMIGKWKSVYGDQAVILAMGAANKAGTPDPVAYITKALQPKKTVHDLKLETWGIGDAKPVRVEPPAWDHDPEASAGTADLPRVQPDAEEEGGPLPFRDPDTGWDRGALPSLRLVSGGAL